MSVEFVDSNILIYAHAAGAGIHHEIAMELISRLAEQDAGAVSVQVLAEFYSIVTGKYKMNSQDAESVIQEFAGWTVHSPGHGDIVSAIRIQQRWRLSWWDSMILHSALAVDADVLWSEAFSDGQKFGDLTVRNPFRVQ